MLPPPKKNQFDVFLVEEASNLPFPRLFHGFFPPSFFTPFLSSQKSFRARNHLSSPFLLLLLKRGGGNLGRRMKGRGKKKERKGFSSFRFFVSIHSFIPWPAAPPSKQWVATERGFAYLQTILLGGGRGEKLKKICGNFFSQQIVDVLWWGAKIPTFFSLP